MSQRILVIGAGFAGMWSALASVRLLDQLGRTDVEIALIAPEPELHVRPRLYEQNPGGMKAPLRSGHSPSLRLDLNRSMHHP